MDADAKINTFEQELNEATTWAASHRSEIPSSVYNIIMLVSVLRSSLEKSRARAAGLLQLFRIQLGIIPKSERGQSQAAAPSKKVKKSDEERLAELSERRKKLLKEIRRYEDRLGKGRKKRQKKTKNPSLPPQPVPEPAENEFLRSEEPLFSGTISQALVENSRMIVNKTDNFDNPRGLHTVADDRTRYEYGVTTKTINLKVETVTDPRTGKSVTASTDEIGPPNSQATWAAIANTVIAVVGYAIPINRLAAMLKKTCPYFTSARLCADLKLAAEMFADVYNYLGQQLPDSDVLQGDDAKARVVEINQALKNGGELDDPPKDSLIEKVADIFGRVFKKKRGKGNKRQLNISVVIGKTIASDPRSYIFFFRSHLGSLGDLLTQLLEMRSPKKKEVTIVADQSTTNQVSPALHAKFNITYAGCGAHARRPFWRHKDLDQRLCYWMLSAFLILEQIEDRIDELGRTRARIERYRQRYSRKVWLAILKRCESVLRGESVYGKHWPKTSKVYEACNYIVKYFKELTRYLDDPRLPANNNLSERVLRWDKIMEDASKFRMTEQGRLQIDILRTIVHTCSAAGVDLKEYLIFIFKNQYSVASDPQNYTPYAYALRSATADRT